MPVHVSATVGVITEVRSRPRGRMWEVMVQDVWPVVIDERRALIEDLRDLSGTQWAMQSLCARWSVHDVLAHLVDTAKTGRITFVRDMVLARFDFDRQNQAGVVRERATTPDETLDRFRAVVDLRRSPPAPLDSRLVEAIVHGEDIRRPLAITRAYPTEAVVDALRLQARTSESMGGAKKLLAGLTLLADDADLRLGDGPIVEGPVLDLLLVASGRTVALENLRGPGLGELRERMAPRG